MGFALGALTLSIAGILLPQFQIGSLGAKTREQTGGIKTLKPTLLLVLAITLHNIPEGLAVGVAFGALACDLNTASPGPPSRWLSAWS